MKLGTMVSDQRNSCSLLSQDENEQVVRMLGHRCQILASTVAQLFQTKEPNHDEWQKHSTGVLCLVKDYQRRSYFFRMFCLIQQKMIWEHEIYKNMDYLAPKNFFHVFEAENCMAGFNFVCESEASQLRHVLVQRLEARQRARAERQSRQCAVQTNSCSDLKGKSESSSGYESSGSYANNSTQSQFNILRATLELAGSVIGSSKNKVATRRGISKCDIGRPRNFRHVSHVGFDPERGFAFDNVDSPYLKQFLAKAGVSQSQLQDRATRKFIYDFILYNGGLSVVEKEMKKSNGSDSPATSRPHTPSAPPPAPPPPLAPTPEQAAPQLPPPLPARAPSMRAAPPPPPSLHCQSTPPPLPSLPPVGAPPPRPSRGPAHRSLSTEESGMRMAPPPPGPPPPPPPPQPPQPSRPSVSGSSEAPKPPPAPPIGLLQTGSTVQSPSQPNSLPDSHAALMEAIRLGTNLRPVTVTRTDSVSSTDTRAALMDQIRQGKKLKSVVPETKAPYNPLPSDSLAGALCRALAERSRAVHNDSSNSDSGGEFDGCDEWDD